MRIAEIDLLENASILYQITSVNKATKKPHLSTSGGAFGDKIPAATYSPTQLPVQYHRPRGA